MKSHIGTEKDGNGRFHTKCSLQITVVTTLLKLGTDEQFTMHRSSNQPVEGMFNNNFFTVWRVHYEFYI